MDVVPSVQPDGYMVQMKLTTSVTEFLGYDDAGGTSSYLRVPGKNGAPPEIIPMPASSGSVLPRVRLREMTVNAVILDGVTVVLGHFRPQDWFGQNQQSSITYSREDPKRNLLVLVTPTISDSAGNRVHTDEELNGRPEMKR